MFTKIDHIGVAVTSLQEVKQLLKNVFELDPSFEEKVEEQMVKVAGFGVGDSNIEFLEPTAADSPIAKFLERRGEGIHHIAVSVKDINETISRFKENGIKLIDDKPKSGAEGKLIAFVHPKSMHGVLLELSQEPE
jgi:methylmalonyl-CoA/ethylmalonyl-CoA epimerase